jgi:hypothetical protein
MAYFDGIKVGDKVWDFVFGWGKVVDVEYLSDFPLKVEFSESNKRAFTKNGEIDNNVNQTLFWGKIEFEVPNKTTIELEEGRFVFDIYKDDAYLTRKSNGEMLIDKNNPFYNKKYRKNWATRNDKKTALIASGCIRELAKLLALRDQECPDSRGFSTNIHMPDDAYYIKINNKRIYCVEMDEFVSPQPGRVYFKTKEDAQKICDILNNGRFEL